MHQTMWATFHSAPGLKTPEANITSPGTCTRISISLTGFTVISDGGLHVPGIKNGTSEGQGASRNVVVLPGLGNAAQDYSDLVEDLENMGLRTSVVPVQRHDWLRNAAGLRDPKYWQGTFAPRPTVNWFLTKLDETVDSLKKESDGAPVTFLAHSAGGWLGRIYLKDFGTTGIDRFVSLGSPHLPLPEDSEGAVDQTRGILTYCEDSCPGAYHSEVDYVTIAGKFVKGSKFAGEGTMQQKLVGLGYQQVCGKSDVWGDGVVPVASAHLEGAHNIDLDGVYHSPVGAAHTPSDDPSAAKERLWYGSQTILSMWSTHLHGVEN